MSAIRITYLYCDGAACHEASPFSTDPLPGEGAAEQRKSAKAMGWIRRKGKDYCEKCAATENRKAG